MSDHGPETQQEPTGTERQPRTPEKPSYQAPIIVKRRAVSRATLFTGSGPSSGGIVSA